MEMTVYENADDFLNENRAILEQHSIDANLIWANAMSHKTVKEGFFGMSITKGASIYLAIQTTPHPMVHFSIGKNVKGMAELLAKYLFGINSLPEKISGIKETVDIFKDAAYNLGVKYAESRHLNLMVCEKVNDINTVSGQYQNQITADFDFGQWFVEFNNDCEIEETIEKAYLNAKRMVENGSLVCFAVNGQPVTMAAKKRKIIGGQCVSAVFTPESYRGKGYSTACIKHLTQEILNEGNDCSFLFADYYNPISNRVYEKVGYKKIMDFMEYTYKD